jgi:hypothetical protein
MGPTGPAPKKRRTTPQAPHSLANADCAAPHFLVSSDVPFEVVAALAALPPPGPDDATEAERCELMRIALPPGVIQALGVRGGDWGRAPDAVEVGAIRKAVRLLRVRLESRRAAAASARDRPCDRDPSLPRSP